MDLRFSRRLQRALASGKESRAAAETNIVVASRDQRKRPSSKSLGNFAR
jgi:hypothetical protein